MSFISHSSLAVIKWHDPRHQGTKGFFWLGFFRGTGASWQRMEKRAETLHLQLQILTKKREKRERKRQTHTEERGRGRDGKERRERQWETLGEKD